MALDTQNKAPFQAGVEVNQNRQEEQPRRVGRRAVLITCAAGGTALVTGGVVWLVNSRTSDPSQAGGGGKEDWTFGQGGQAGKQEAINNSGDPYGYCQNLISKSQVKATIGLMVPGATVSPDQCLPDGSGEPLTTASIANDKGDRLELSVTSKPMDWSNPDEYDPFKVSIPGGRHVDLAVSKMPNHPWVGIKSPDGYSVVVDYDPAGSSTKQHVEQAVGLARVIANQF